MFLRPGLVLLCLVARCAWAAGPSANQSPSSPPPAPSSAEVKDEVKAEVKAEVKDEVKDEVKPEVKTAPSADKDRLFSMTVRHKEADDTLISFARAAHVELQFLSPATEMITLSFEKVTFTQALDLICEAGNLQWREKNGLIIIALPMDMQLKFPLPNETNLDAAYRCKHLDADALSSALSRVLPPEVKISQGPRFMSPSLDSNSDPSGVGGADQTVKALSATDTSFKVHDIVLSGPADMVRRAIQLARKFDRPRKQVKINIRIAEVQDNNTQNLGVSWMQSLNLSATEAANGTNAAGGPTVAGIRLGSFSHTPLVVNATLNALETKGKAKTLSNPTLLLLDGERSFILSGQKILYPKYSGKDQSGQSIYDTAELKVGIYLQVAVQIGLNKDVVMSLIPQVTSVVSFSNYNNGQYPIVQTREAQTTVHAYSGEMVVLGGLKSSTESDERDGIPFLKDIPFFGRIFSTNNKIKNKSELMIFLTPEIEDDLDHVEDIHVNVSKPE